MEQFLDESLEELLEEIMKESVEESCYVFPKDFPEALAGEKKSQEPVEDSRKTHRSPFRGSLQVYLHRKNSQ